MRRWDNKTSFISRLSRRFPTYSFAELVALMKQRSRATYIARYVRKVLKKHPELAFSMMGSDWRDHWWTDPWWKTWKSQWELASNQSLRQFYGLRSNEKDIPQWTRFAKHRVALPDADELREWQVGADVQEQPITEEMASELSAEEELKRSLENQKVIQKNSGHTKKPFGAHKDQSQATTRQKNQNTSAAGLLFSSQCREQAEMIDLDLSQLSDFDSYIHKYMEYQADHDNFDASIAE